MDHWAKVGALPDLCDLPEENVLGPVIELSSGAAKFLKVIILIFRKSFRQLLIFSPILYIASDLIVILAMQSYNN